MKSEISEISEMSPRSCRRPAPWVLGTLLVALAGTTLSAAAQDRAPARERSGILFGAFIASRDTQTRLDSGNGTGTSIDLEKDLGLASTTSVFRLEGYRWFGEKQRQRADFSWFRFARSSTLPIEETIEFGDRVFQINTEIETKNTQQILKADYTFAALNRQRGFLGITAGFYIMDASLSLREKTLGTAETGDLTAPLPVVGLRGEYAISERITLRGASQWFGYHTDTLDGSFRDSYIGADYKLKPNTAIGLAYNDVIMKVGAQEVGSFEGELSWGYEGWLLYLKHDFGR